MSFAGRLRCHRLWLTPGLVSELEELANLLRHTRLKSGWVLQHPIPDFVLTEIDDRPARFGRFDPLDEILIAQRLRELIPFMAGPHFDKPVILEEVHLPLEQVEIPV